MKTNNKGFTLVELLAVIVILAVLLGIAMPAISNVQTAAKQGTAEDEAMTFVEQIRTCIMASGDDKDAVKSCATKYDTGTTDASGAKVIENGSDEAKNYLNGNSETQVYVELKGTSSSDVTVVNFVFASTQGFMISTYDYADVPSTITKPGSSDGKDFGKVSANQTLTALKGDLSSTAW